MNKRHKKMLKIRHREVIDYVRKSPANYWDMMDKLFNLMSEDDEQKRIKNPEYLATRTKEEGDYINNYLEVMSFKDDDKR